MGVQQSQHCADQSEGDASCVRGSSYVSTLPFNMPSKGRVPRGRRQQRQNGHRVPRLVMVTEHPSLCIS